jgi:hypothetical protein
MPPPWASIFWPLMSFHTAPGTIQDVAAAARDEALSTKSSLQSNIANVNCFALGALAEEPKNIKKRKRIRNKRKKCSMRAATKAAKGFILVYMNK